MKVGEARSLCDNTGAAAVAGVAIMTEVGAAVVVGMAAVVIVAVRGRRHLQGQLFRVSDFSHVLSRQWSV